MSDPEIGDGSVERLHPAYRKILRGFGRQAIHAGTVELREGSEIALARHGTCELSASIRIADHVVERAAFRGSMNEAQRAIMELLCDQMEGRPLPECRDHVVIRMERLLRQAAAGPPVPGVIMPENADPIFSLPLMLVRSLADEYEKRVGLAEEENRYLESCSEAWRTLRLEEKRKALQNCVDYMGASDILEVIAPEDDGRVILGFKAELGNAQKQHHLMRAESEFRKTLDPCIRVYVGAEEDKNRLRVLKVTQR